MTLITLTHSEVVEFDHDVLADLCQRHGTAAEAHIALILSEVEDLLALASVQVDAGQHAGLSRSCTDLVWLARMIGMRTMVDAVTAVQDCLSRGDAAALPACASRMLRLGRPEAIDHWTVRHNTVA